MLVQRLLRLTSAPRDISWLLRRRAAAGSPAHRAKGSGFRAVEELEQSSNCPNVLMMTGLLLVLGIFYWLASWSHSLPLITCPQMLWNRPTDGSLSVKFLTDSVSSSLAAVVKERHVSQTITVVYVATTLQDLRERKQQRATHTCVIQTDSFKRLKRNQFHSISVLELTLQRPCPHPKKPQIKT